MDEEAPVAAPQLAPPGKFDFTNANEWPRWLKRFERYRIVSGLNKQSQEFQVNAFMYAAGDNAEDILNVLPLTDAQKSCTRRWRQPSPHTASANETSYMKEHASTDGIKSWVMHTLAEHCEFGTLREQLIRDRIVVGLRDAKLSENLQLDADLTLENAIRRVKQSAAVKRQQPVLRGTGQVTGHVDVMYKNTAKGQKVTKQKYDMQSSECSRCGNVKKTFLEGLSCS
ncbi:hypothetical protein N1851_028708 [Merluccius polli]|uniref:Uncharacterized protein n=1 Tax=Merluccius polli TaxID=89951 RepID=A0AA47NRA6_MERPO|nr:hypothetical protein N1851_028708 [Merluccius polli]